MLDGSVIRNKRFYVQVFYYILAIVHVKTLPEIRKTQQEKELGIQRNSAGSFSRTNYTDYEHGEPYFQIQQQDHFYQMVYLIHVLPEGF